MLAVELEDERTADRLVKYFIDEGLVTDRFLFKPSAFRIAPPLVITPEQVKKHV